MSIEAQRRACLEFAEKQGWMVYKIYVDEARSGTSDDRAAFQEMIAGAAAKNPPFEVVLVHKLDRFARNRYDSVKYKALLRRRGIRVVSASQPILGSGDPTEVLLEAMLEGMDEFYSLNLARESLKGMAENARHGWWNGGFAPFGYRAVHIQTEKGEKRKLGIELSEAEIVRRIYAMYLKGQGVNAIRHRLNLEGVRYRGGYRFTKNLVLGILRNEKYCGDATFGKTLNKRKRPMDWKLEAITVKNAHEPVVSREDWDRTQALLNSRRKSVKQPQAVNSEYLFAGAMECAFCGCTFVGTGAHGHGGHYRYYVCNTIIRAGASSCPQRKFNAETLEQVFITKLRERMTAREAIRDLITARNQMLKEAHAQQARVLPRLERELRTIDRRQRKIFESIADQKIGLTKEDIAPYVRELAAMRAQKELERDQLRAQLGMRPVKVSDAAIEELADFYQALFEDNSFVGRKRLVQGLLVSVRIDERYAHLSYNPALTPERDRVPISDGDHDGGPDHNGSEPPPEVLTAQKWLP